MEKLRSVAEVICVIVFISGILLMLVPMGKMEKLIKFIVGAFVIYSIFSAFLDSENFNFELDLESETGISEEVEEYILQQYDEDIELRLVTSLTELLEEEGILVESLQISINKNEDNNITITMVEVKLADESDSDNASEILTSELPDVVIVFE